MDNVTLMLDADSHDLVMDNNQSLLMIGGADTVAQCVRVTLEAFKNEWFLDAAHGTDYEQIIGDGTGDPELVLREAVFQETQVQYIDQLEITKIGRMLQAKLTARMKDGTRVYLEVGA